MIVTAGALLTRSAFLVLSSSSLLLEQLVLVTHETKLQQPQSQEDFLLSPSSSPLLFQSTTEQMNSPTEARSESSTLLTAQPQDSFYPSATASIRYQVTSLLDQSPSLAGPLIRLAFHDATTYEKSNNLATGGPNGSIQYELDWSENRGLSKPLALVQDIWAKVNNQLHRNDRVISLADVIAVAGATAIEYVGGPTIPLRMGRPTASTADLRKLRHPMQLTTERSKVESTMPSAGMDSDGLRLYFGTRGFGFQEEEWVALCGIHGLGRHVSLLGMSKQCLKDLTRDCLENAPQSLPFVTSSVDRFSNAYFQYLLLWNQRQVELGDVAFIPTDVDLVVDAGLRRHVRVFANDEAYFRKVFVRAYQKLVETTATTAMRY